LRIVCFSYILSGITSAYDISLCCSEKANIPFISRFIGLIVNLVMNWALIYGHLGFSAMGIEGAAIATVIARGVELVFILSVVYGKKLIQAAPFREMFSFPKGMLKKYFAAALPVTLPVLPASVPYANLPAPFLPEARCPVFEALLLPPIPPQRFSADTVPAGKAPSVPTFYKKISDIPIPCLHTPNAVPKSKAW